MIGEDTGWLEGSLEEGKADLDTGEAANFLVFRLGPEEYGAELAQVQEIKAWEPVTEVPHQPPHVLGLTNLRGLIVPVVDLRLWFGVGEPEYHERTAVIMFRIEDRIAGVVVDTVSDVIGLAEEQIGSPPDGSSGVNADYLAGIASANGRMVALVDMARLLGSPAMGLVDPDTGRGA